MAFQRIFWAYHLRISRKNASFFMFFFFLKGGKVICTDRTRLPPLQPSPACGPLRIPPTVVCDGCPAAVAQEMAGVLFSPKKPSPLHRNTKITHGSHSGRPQDWLPREVMFQFFLAKYTYAVFFLKKTVQVFFWHRRRTPYCKAIMSGFNFPFGISSPHFPPSDPSETRGTLQLSARHRVAHRLHRATRIIFDCAIFTNFHQYSICS